MYVSDWTHDKIYQVSLIDDDVRALDVSTVTDPTGVLYDPVSQRVIWGDTNNQFIQSAHINGTGYAVLVDVGMYF
ncbi:hypothetical protein DPMN_174694 [Dreissena polymorpha]|uniref:Low-density lipoprotein receptor repeat class B n=1 Tax=Dreissena polymorpha TaxID=45954 RepID=A0A9D4E6G2_DREPO|nr:hypothetical protein DPMN_174694 [Dreissena polymorpha]